MTKINELILFNDDQRKNLLKPKTGAIKSYYIILKSTYFHANCRKNFNIPNYKVKKVTIITGKQIIRKVIVNYCLSVF